MKCRTLIFFILIFIELVLSDDSAQASVENGALPAVLGKSEAMDEDFEPSAELDARRLHIESQSPPRPIRQRTEDPSAQNVSSSLLSQMGSRFQFKSGLQLQTGQQQVNQSGLLFSNNHNNARGAELSDSSGGYDLQLFGYQTQPSISCNELSVDYEPARYNSGASFRLNDGNHWTFSSTYFASNSTSEIEAGSDSSETGTWDISAGSEMLNKSVITRLEYAHSMFADYRSKNTSDRAVDTQIDFSSPTGFSLPPFGHWSAGLHYRSVGSDYYSIGELDLPNGLDETHVFFESAIKNVAFNIGWRLENQQHLDSLTLLAQQERREMVSLTYTPQIDDGNVLRHIFGNPSLTTHFHRVGQNEPEFVSPDGIQPIFSDIDERGLKFESAQKRWDWSIEYQESVQHRQFMAMDLEPTERLAPDWYTNSTFFRFGMNPADDFSLRLKVQLHRKFEVGNSSGDSQRLYNIKARFDVIPNSCSISMQYAYENSLSSLYAGDDMKTDVANQMSSAELSWRAISFSGSRPAVDLFLKSSFGKFNDYSSINDERWSAQLSMKLYWGTQQL